MILNTQILNINSGSGAKRRDTLLQCPVASEVYLDADVIHKVKMTKPLMSIELLAMVKLLGMRDHINEESFWKMYKKLRRLFYQSTAWRKLATKVRRKQGKCMFCKKTVPLDVHHVVYLFNDPTRGLDMTNLVALCRKHHNEIHEGKLKVAA